MRILTSMVILVFTIEWAHGQPYLNVGFRGGGNSSSINFVPRIRDRTASIQGYQIGGTIQYVNMDHVGIQLDGLLINQGWRQIADDLTETKYKIDYLHFPLTSYIYAGEKRTRFFINAGVYLNFRMNGKRTVTNPDGTTQNYDYNYNSERDNLVIYGLTGGGGISYDAGIGIIGADLRITFSYGSLMKPDIPERDFSREQVLSMNSFYQFKVINRSNR